jgi:DNA-binding SARP family transcriptional activator
LAYIWAMARLELSLLGGFRASVDGSPITGFDTDKTRALLVYVCVEASHPHGREALAGLLWPELPEEAARRNLRNSLFKLRQAIGDEGAGQAPLLHVTPQTVQLDPNADYWLDLAEFTNLVAACRAHRHRKLGHCTTCHARLQQVAALYRGDFLRGSHLADCQEFEEWLVLKREALHREAIDTLGRLSTYHEARAEYGQALQYAYRQLELEPWREEVHRQAMRLLAVTGQRSAALAQFENCRRTLAQELSAEPSEETVALYESIKAGNRDQGSGVRGQGSGIRGQESKNQSLIPGP